MLQPLLGSLLKLGESSATIFQSSIQKLNIAGVLRGDLLHFEDPLIGSHGQGTVHQINDRIFLLERFICLLIGKRVPGMTGNRRFQIVNSRVALGDHPFQFNKALKAAIRFLTHLTSDPGQL